MRPSTHPHVALNGILLACPVPVSFAEKMALLKEILSCDTDDELTKLAHRWLSDREKKEKA